MAKALLFFLPLFLWSPTGGDAADSCGTTGAVLVGGGCVCPGGTRMDSRLGLCLEVKAVEAIQGFNPESLTPPADSCGPTLAAEGDGGEDSAANCEFLKRRGDDPALRLNWALDATGAELLRTHPAVLRANYDKNKVIALDTGFNAAGNPDAGDMGPNPPEGDPDGHGTHVAGIIGSQKYGVNPKLKVSVFPVNGSKVPVPPAGPGGQPSSKFTFEKSALDKALDLVTGPTDPKDWADPKYAPYKDVSVINISISAKENPIVEEIIQKMERNCETAKAQAAQNKTPLEAGACKLIVWAGENQGQLNSRANAGLAKNAKSKSVFSVGNLSPFGAPAKSSNFGPNVEFWSAGTSIESLGGPNPGAKSLSGTSMAAPHVAAVLGTLKAIYPALTGEEADLLLKKTAIKRGTNPPLLQVNDFAAVTVLEAAKFCVAAGKSMMDCLKSEDPNDSAMVQVKQTAENYTPVKRETGCKMWEDYLNQLRRAYFLSGGSEKWAKAIAEFFEKNAKMPNAIEKEYFRAAGAANGNPVGLPEGSSPAVRAARERAIAFARGELDPIDLSTPAGQQAAQALRSKPVELLSKLPATPEAAEHVMAVCQSYFQTGRAEANLAKACNDYLINGPHAFRVAMGQKLEAFAKGPPPKLLAAAETLNFLNIDTSRPPEDEIRSRLLPFVGNTIDPSKLPTLSPADRAAYYERIKKALDEGKMKVNAPEGPRLPTEVEKKEYLARLQSYLPQDANGEKAMREYLTPRDDEGKPLDPTVGAFLYEARKIEAGHGNADTTVAAFKALMKKSGEKDARVGEAETATYPSELGNSYNTRAMIIAMGQPRVALGLAKSIVEDPSVLDSMPKAMTSVAVLQKLLERTQAQDPALADKLFQAVIDRARNNNELIGGRGIANKPDGDRLLGFLQATQNIPASRALLDSILKGTNPGVKGGAKPDEYVQAVQDAAVKFEAGQATAPNQAVQRYLDLVKQQRADGRSPDSPAFNVKPDVIVQSPALRQEFRDSVTRLQGEKERSDRLFALLATAPPATTKELAKDVIPSLSALWGRATAVSYDRALQFGGALGTALDPAQRTAVLQQVDQVLATAAPRKSGVPGATVQDIAIFVQGFAARPEGAQALAQNPDFTKKLAAKIVSSTSEAQSPVTNFDSRIKIPAPLAAELAPLLPAKLPKDGQQVPPDWIRGVISQEPSAVGRAMEYYAEAKKLLNEAPDNKRSQQQRVMASLVQSVVTLAANSKEAREKILAVADPELRTLMTDPMGGGAKP